MVPQRSLWFLNNRCGEDSGQRLQADPASSTLRRMTSQRQIVVTPLSDDDSSFEDDIIWWGCHESSSCVPIVNFDLIVPLSYRRHHRPQIVVVIESIMVLFPLPLVCMVFILRLQKRLSLGREIPPSSPFLLICHLLFLSLGSPPPPLHFWRLFFLSFSVKFHFLKLEAGVKTSSE